MAEIVNGGENFLALDLGASSGRAVLGRVSEQGLVTEEVHRFKNGPVERGGELHWDAARLGREIVEGIRRGRERAGTLRGVGVDTWGVDFGLLDEKGELLSDPFHYRDGRTDGMMERVFEIVARERIFELTGIQFLQFNTLFQLAAMKLGHAPELERAARLLMMPDLFHYQLCGVGCSEFSIATTTQFYNPRAGGWAAELFAALDLPARILPPIVAPGTVLGALTGEVARAGGEVPVIAPAAHDTGSAVAAAPVDPKLAPGSWAYLSSGTWSLMGLELREPIISPAALAHNFTNEGGAAGTWRFLKNIAGLWFLQECRRTWLDEGECDYDEMENWALCAEPFRSFIDVDDPSFLRPDNMPRAIADFCRRTHQPVPASKGDFIRVILESLALKYRLVRDALEQAAGAKIEVLHIIGGGSQNDLLNRFTADALNLPVIAGPVEATALGNLAVQAVAARVLPDLPAARALIRHSFPLKTYAPHAPAEWDEVFARYGKIIPTNSAP